MGQYWNIFDLDGETHIKPLGKLGESFWSSGGHSLVKVLARPVPSREPTRGTETLMRPYQRRSKGLFKLPLELLELIMKKVDSQSDLLSFVVATRTLYAIGYKVFQAALCRYEVPCAGHRLICLGDNCKNDDLPPGWLLEDIEKVLPARNENVKRHEGGDEDEECQYEEDEDGENRFHTYASYNYPGPTIVDSSMWAHLWKKRSVEDRWISRALRLEDWAVDDLLQRRYPSDLQWVLCNLTKRVYFTADAVSKFTGEKPDGPFFDHDIGMGEVLLAQICWSSDPQTYILGDMHRGKWAADRFEITTMDRLSNLKPVEGGEDKEWEDVSDDVVGEMEDIFRLHFGDSDPCNFL